MNCKPGDLALLVRNTSGLRCMGNVIGAPVRVTELAYADIFLFGPAWRYESALHCPNCHRRILVLLDADLLPLRPDGLEGESPTQIIEELTA